MKYIKKLWGYGKTFAKHMWDLNKGYLANKAYRKVSQKARKYIPQQQKPLFDQLSKQGQRYIENKFSPNYLRNIDFKNNRQSMPGSLTLPNTNIFAK